MPRHRKPTPPTAPPTPGDPAEVPLTNEERLFVENVLIDGNRTRAYREVFPKHMSYHSAAAAASRMAKRPHVAQEIRAGRAAIARKFQLGQNQVTQELMRIAFSDLVYAVDANDQLVPLRRIPLELRRAISSVDVLRERVTTTRNGKTKTTRTECVIRYKLWNKLDALDKLANMLGLKTSIPPIEVLFNMLPRELAEQLRIALASQPRQNGQTQPSVN